MNELEHKTISPNHAFLGTIFQPLFTGKEKDSETGYYYFGARYYNPDLSLWLSVDPMSDKYPSLSPYNYCAWNPMKFTDPDGQEKHIFFKTTKPTYNTYRQFKNDLKNYNKNVFLDNAAKRYRDKSDVIHVFAHGAPHIVDFASKGEKNAQKLESYLINNSKVYQKNIDENKISLLVLHSCNTGKGENSIAQQLSQQTDGNLLVIAPSDYLNVTPTNGENVDNNGVWNVFYKGEKVGSYSGDTNFEDKREGKNPQNIINYWKQQYEKKHTSE